MLFRLRVDAEAAAHPRRGVVLRQRVQYSGGVSDSYNLHILLVLMSNCRLGNLWKYMGAMYELDAFSQSVPADQDILNHYKLQQVSFAKFSSGINN